MPASAFITAVQPNFDSGIAAVPTVAGAVPGATNTLPLWLSGLSFANTSGVAVTIRVTDGAGATIIPDILLPANSEESFGPWNVKPITGLRWSASGNGVNGQAWGYQ